MAKNVVKKKEINYLQSVKDLTKWLTNPRRSDEVLTELIEKHKLKNTVARRILSYNFGFPYIIKYFNDYFNDLYSFDSYDTNLLIRSIVYLMDVNNRSNSKLFMYIKSSELKDEIKEIIKGLIKDYLLTVHDIVCNRRDLDIYYRLFKMGVIKDEDLLEIDRLLNGDKPLIKSFDFINYSDAIKVQDSEEELEEPTERVLSNAVTTFINEIKLEKSRSSVCQSCPLFQKQMVVLDTNNDEVGPVDVAFIGLNPGKDEAELGIPFIGDSGQYIRNLIKQLPKEIKWVIFNIILCSTNNKTEIPNVDNTIRNCMDLTKKIFEKFSAKTYVPIGDDAKSVFGVDGKISAVSGKIHNQENNITIIPLIHPSSVLRNSKNKSIFDKSVQNIITFVTTGSEVQSSSNAKEKVIENIENVDGLLLLDIKRIDGNKLLMIFTDLAGNKKYVQKDYSFPVLIKNKEWNECDIITDSITDSCKLTDWQKSNVSKKCHQLLKQMVNI